MMREGPPDAIPMAARDARAHAQQAAAALERVRTHAIGDPEIVQLTAAATNAADALLIAIGEIRHRLAERVMLSGYPAAPRTRQT
jgi:nucleotide-binding universal stress UspA family protein